MATYASSPTLVLPEYTPEVNLGIYAAGLQQKTQQYYAGIQKVQGVIDNIAGLELSRDVDKQHLNNLFADLQTKISNTVNSDFSSLSVVNSVAGMAGSIYRDSQIKNGVASTANLKAFTKAQAELKEKHPDRYSPENEYWDNKGKMEYLNSTDPNATFRQTTPTPYTDINKIFLENFKSVKPDSDLTQQDFVFSPEGGLTVLNEKSFEGIDADQIRSVIRMTTSRGDVQQQLMISSDYNYQNISRNTLNQRILATSDQQKALFKKEFENQKAYITSNMAEDQVAQTKALTKLEELYNERIESADQFINQINELDDAQLKKWIYQTDWENNIIGAYSYSKTSNKYLTSPMNEARLKKLNYDLQASKENRTLGKDVGTSVVPSPINVAQILERDPSVAFDDQLDMAKQELNENINSIVVDYANLNSIKAPKRKTEKGWEYNVDKSGVRGYRTLEEAQQAEKDLYSQITELNEKGNASSQISNKFERINDARKNVEALEYIKNQIENSPEVTEANQQIVNVLSNIPDVFRNAAYERRSVAIGGGIKENTYQDVTKQDLIDLYHSQKGDSRAYQKLVEKFGEENIKNAVGKTQSTIFGIPSVHTYNEGTPYEFTFGIGRAGEGILARPEVYKAYSQIRDAYELNPSFQESVSLKNEAYRQAITERGNYDVTYTDYDPKTRKSLGEQFRSILQGVTVAKGDRWDGRRKGQAEKLLNSFAKDKDGNINYEGTSIGYTIDQTSGKVFMFVYPSTEVRTPEHYIEIPKEMTSELPGMTNEDFFRIKHGTTLGITQYQTTDFRQAGETDAYRIKTAQNNPYNVKYHLIRDSNGEGYHIKLYVRNKTINNKGSDENLILNGVLAFSEDGEGYTPSQVEAQLQRLKDPNYIQRLINTYTKK